MSSRTDRSILAGDHTPDDAWLIRLVGTLRHHRCHALALRGGIADAPDFHVHAHVHVHG